MVEVSVVIPCYNSFPFLEDCLRSVIGQTYQNWEAIVVDDQSTDGDIATIIASLNDSRIRMVRHTTNRGLAAARNTGFTVAHAQLVLPLDSDDMLAPTCLTDMATELKQDLSIDSVMCDFELFGIESGKWPFKIKPLPMLTDHQWLPGAGVMIRKRLWKDTGGYCESRQLRAGNEDWDFWLSAAQHGLNLTHIPKLLYRYRRHKTSMAVTLHQTEHRTRKYIYQRHKTYFDQHGAGKKFIATGYWRAAIAARNQHRLLTSLLYATQAMVRDGNISKYKNSVYETCVSALSRQSTKMP